MSQHKQSLLAAVASTVCAAIWLANCGLDIAQSLHGSLPRDGLLTLVWTISAVCWWVRWRRERKWAQQA